jgi:hypothetical protein
MRTQSADTHPDAERVQIELLRQAAIARRVGLVRSLSQTTMWLAWRAIQRAHPGASDAQVACTFASLHYGQTVGDRLWSALPPRTTMIPPDMLAALTPVVEALEQLGVAYYIGGSVASSAYGIPRSTLDVDLVADLRPEHVRPLVDDLQAAYYVDEGSVRDALQRRASFNVIHLQTMIKVDVCIPQGRAFDRAEAQRVRQETLDDAPDARTFALTAPEDVILRKLEGYRAGGEVSERQWHDLLGVLKVQARALDLAYLRRWATTLSVADLLDRALDDAGL